MQKHILARSEKGSVFGAALRGRVLWERVLDMCTTAVYPGSFDPCTNGHLDVIRRAARLFDNVVVAVLINDAKNPLFTIEERVDMIKKVTKQFPNVTVRSFSGLLADFMKENNYSLIIKGLRAVSDFEYEFQMALVNKDMCHKAETIFLAADVASTFLSSSMVKQIAMFGGDISAFVPACILDDINKRLILRKDK